MTAEQVLGYVFWHPRRGTFLTAERLPPGHSKWRGGKDSDWEVVTRVYVILGGWAPRAVPGQKLPKSYLWGDITKQVFGLGAGHRVFGPLERKCHGCGEWFVWPAEVQKHLYEELRAPIDTVANRCRPCARAYGKLQTARKAYQAAIEAAKESEDVKTLVEVARATLGLLEAGGRARVDRAIGTIRKARRLGAGAVADRLEEKLAARLAGRARRAG